MNKGIIPLQWQSAKEIYIPKVKPPIEPNDSSNESTTSESSSKKNTTSESTSGRDEDSSQEESCNQTIKRKPDSISPPENQPQPKIVNCTTTPKSVTEKTTSSNDNDDSPSLTTKSSDTSRDSHGLLIDESDPNTSPQDGADLPMDISDEDEQTKTPATDDQTEIPDDEQTEKHVPYSYSLNLPTVKQLMAQKSLPKPYSEQSRDERLKSAGQFAKVIMRSPDTRDHTIEKENQHKEEVKGRTIYGSCLSENGDRPYLDPEKLLSNTLTKIILKLSTKLQVTNLLSF